MDNNTVLKTHELIRHIFFEVLDIVGRVFVVIAYTDLVKIGTRGFLPEEKEKGLTLVLNKQMNFQWKDDGINASLVFNGTLQKCFVPVSNIMAIYSPELKMQFVIEPLLNIEQNQQDDIKLKEDLQEIKDTESKIVQVDFTRKRK